MAATLPQSREPVPVSVLRFADDRQEVPGSIMSSACTSALVKPTSRHLIHYLPWLRCFQVDYLTEQGGRGTVAESVMIPEGRVMSWTTPLVAGKEIPRKR